MSDLSNLFSSALSLEPTAPSLKSSRGQSNDVLPITDSKPVLQLNSIPSVIDLAKYKDAYAADNPDGDYLAAYRFRALSNQIPSFTRYYDLSGNTVEKIWGNLVYGAEALSPASKLLLNKTQDTFENYKLSNLAGIPDPWLPVGAWPPTWYDLIDDAPLLRLDLDGQALSTDEFNIIGKEDQLVWKTQGGSEEIGGRVQRISLKILKVNLLREWLDFQIFSMADWRMAHREGYYSSGNLNNNDGIFPLLPTTIIVGTEVTVEGDWMVADRKIIESHRQLGVPLGLGPFPLNVGKSNALIIDSAGTITSKVAHIVGYISALVPFAPKLSMLVRGSVLVQNNGAFVARFSVLYQQAANTTPLESGNFPALSGKNIDIPASATNITVKIEIMTFPYPFETWKSVAIYQFDKPVTKSYRLSGTTVVPEIAEIDFPRSR